MTMCSIDDDLLLLPFLFARHLENVQMYKCRSLYSCLNILPFSISKMSHLCEAYIVAS